MPAAETTSSATSPHTIRPWHIPWHWWLIAVAVVLACCAAVTWGTPKSMVMLKSAAAIAGVVCLRHLVVGRKRPKRILAVIFGLIVLAGGALGVRTYVRYHTADTMTIPLTEYLNDDYPEDPAIRSPHYGKYNGRTLTLIRKDDSHFDFVIESDQEHVAKVVFQDVDVSLMTPSVPDWTKDDPDLVRIALTDRQWNRQEVTFDRDSPHVEISGGDGYEVKNIYKADLAKNCLNAGLWEVLLFVQEDGEKKIYYHGWFTFPHGHYQDLLEQNTGLDYWKHWYYLEHWFDPAGRIMVLEKLREIQTEHTSEATFPLDERIVHDGCQIKKRRTVMSENLITWGDFYRDHKIEFATFIPPGKYSVSHPWGNEYRRMDRFEKAVVRTVKSPATEAPLDELELIFSSSTEPGQCRFIASGIDFSSLPQLAVEDYADGLYMPMGIGVPPFHQDYPKLLANPPDKSPYFSFLLDEDGRWIDHHKFAIDGPVMHLDADDPEKLHVYLLSYERHSLVAHIIVTLKAQDPNDSSSTQP